MPIYEYRCRSCDQEFEHLVRSVESTEKVVCPECNSRKVERRLSVFAAHQGHSGAPAVPAGGCGRCGEAGSCAMRPDF